jgi:predicted ATPase
MRTDLPSGTVTFLFTDVEGSTKLLHELGAEGYADALAEHRRILREAFQVHGGVEVDTQGDAFFVAFPTADGALAAATTAREALAAGPIRVRMGIHTGMPHLADEGYVSADVHRAARIAASGHGGQVLVSAATAAVVVTPAMRDLGEHRLKDFAEPVSIYQLGDERFPPLRTISNTNLPHPASSFVGREREVDEVAGLLQGGARLLTLTGPGGSGKTRLAIEAAASLVPEFKAGVFWVGLAPVRDPALVSETIGQTLGAKDGLADHIGEREMLLLIDNLEQVIAAAPDLASLVESCPNLRLLVTSRERLRVRGEVEYPVAPLADPEAVDLFCARSQTEPDDAIRRLCRALDNLPLAIELAAARSSILTPAQILERLSGRLDLLKGGRDADPRQQTLRATIEWSFDLLTPDEQRLFARLAVFAGGCTLESAEAVAEADLDTLQSLVDKSLVRHTADRFWMLETIREYAAERLEASGKADEIRRRHAEFFLALAEEAYPHVRVESLRGGRLWLDRLESEVDNLRTALDWFEAAGQSQALLRMVGATSEFMLLRGHVSEGLGRGRSALNVDSGPTEARARGLEAVAELAIFDGDVAQAKQWAQEALDIYRGLDDASGVAECLWALGYMAAEEYDWATAHRLLRESLRLCRELGSEYHVPWITRTLAFAYAQSGDLERARELYEDGLRAAQRLGARAIEATLLASLAWLAVAGGRAREALPLLRKSLIIRREIDERSEIAVGLCSVAHALTALGRAETATSLIACFDSLRAEVGSGETWVIRMNAETLTNVRAQIDDATFTQAWERGRALTLEDAAELALDSLGSRERDST